MCGVFILRFSDGVIRVLPLEESLNFKSPPHQNGDSPVFRFVPDTPGALSQPSCTEDTGVGET